MACERLGLRRCWDFIFQRIRSKTSARNRLRKSTCPQCVQTLPVVDSSDKVYTSFSFCSRVTAHSADTAAVCLGYGSKSRCPSAQTKGTWSRNKWNGDGIEPDSRRSRHFNVFSRAISRWLVKQAVSCSTKTAGQARQHQTTSAF